MPDNINELKQDADLPELIDTARIATDGLGTTFAELADYLDGTRANPVPKFLVDS